MLEGICLFFPGIIGVFIVEKIRNNKLSRRDWLGIYAIYVVVINFIALGVKAWILHTGEMPLSDGNILVLTALKYLIVAVPIAIVLGVLTGLYNKVYAFRFFREKPEALDKIVACGPEEDGESKS